MTSIWESPDLGSYEIWLSGLLIFLGGTLLNGAGLGGGGVFVTVLFTIMHMDVHEAIPNSKMIIFISSVALFILKMVKKNNADNIDFNIVGSIVPLALAGTTVGILINTAASDLVLFVLLCCLMGALVVVSITIASRKIREHKKQPQVDATIVGHVQLQEDLEEAPSGTIKPAAGLWSRRNFFLLSLLVLVIVCGIIFKTESVPVAVQWTFFGISISACLAAAWILIDTSGPKVYPILGLAAGISSGLFGVGGGMLIAPALLHLKIDPPVAIAVSATCVLFTSASSALQYLFIGRVAVWISLFLSLFGILSAVAASYAATAISKVTDRPYIMHVLVAVAVMLSAGATLVYTIIAFTTN